MDLPLRDWANQDFPILALRSRRSGEVHVIRYVLSASPEASHPSVVALE